MNCRVSRDRKSDQSHLTKKFRNFKSFTYGTTPTLLRKEREKEKKVILIRENKRTAGKDFFREMKYLLEKDNRFKVT